MMREKKDKPLSLCERNFILSAVAESKRLDGRQTYDYRRIKVEFGSERGCCQVHLGFTRVLAQVSCEVTVPKSNRPAEGQLFVGLEIPPMAAPHFEAGRFSETAVELNRLLERCLRDSRCIDLESLCIIAGEQVWTIRLDIRVLNHDGNISDCASIAAISALSHFRRPDITVLGECVTIHPAEERAPIPLSVHHMPICVTFAFLENGKYLLLDPTSLEERAKDGEIVLGVNSYREICTLHMSGKLLLLKDQLLRCTSIASKRVGDVTDIIKIALATDSAKRSSSEKVGFSQNVLANTLLGSHFDAIHVQLQAAEKPKHVKTVPNIADGEEMETDDEEEDEANNPNEPRVNIMGPGTGEIQGPEACIWVNDDESEQEVSAKASISNVKRNNEKTKKLAKNKAVTNSEKEVLKKKVNISSPKLKRKKNINQPNEKAAVTVNLIEDGLDESIDCQNSSEEREENTCSKQPSRGWYSKKHLTASSHDGEKQIGKAKNPKKSQHKSEDVPRPSRGWYSQNHLELSANGKTEERTPQTSHHLTDESTDDVTPSPQSSRKWYGKEFLG